MNVSTTPVNNEPKVMGSISYTQYDDICIDDLLPSSSQYIVN